jgi:hypothetical protein
MISEKCQNSRKKKLHENSCGFTWQIVVFVYDYITSNKTDFHPSVNGCMQLELEELHLP